MPPAAIGAAYREGVQGGWLVFDAGPLERVRSFTKGKVLGDLAVAKCEPVGESSTGPVGCALQTDPCMEVHDHLVAMDQELFRLAGTFGPGFTPLPHVFPHFLDATVGAGGRKPLRLNPHDLWIKVSCHGQHVVAVDRGEELSQGFNFSVHGSWLAAAVIARPIVPSLCALNKQRQLIRITLVRQTSVDKVSKEFVASARVNMSTGRPIFDMASRWRPN